MPHLVILYTSNLESETDMGLLCRSLANSILTVRDEDSHQPFPTGGTRVLAYPAAHYAVADSKRDYAFVYMNLRIGRGRSAEVKKRLGDALMGAARAHFEALLSQRYIGLTLQVDEGQEVFDAKHGSIHPLFTTPK